MERPAISQNGPLSAVVDLRRRVGARALEVFRGWSYREIDVPLLDYFDALRSALDPEQVGRLFRFVDRDGNLLVLRSDVTPAIAKIYANQLAGAPLPLRLCYANKVVRIERAFTREQIESYQLGVELIGAAGPEPEIEVILVALETLAAIGVSDYEVHLGNAAVVERLVALSGVPAAQRGHLAGAIRERDPHAVHALVGASPVDPSVLMALNAIAQLSAGQEALEALRDIEPPDAALAASLDELLALHEALVALGAGDRVHFDLGLGNEFGYYTGTRFKIVSERVGRVLGGGGRYDELIGRFGAPTPAVGFSISLEAVLELLEGTGRRREPADEPTTIATVGGVVEAFRSALARRRAGDMTRMRFDVADAADAEDAAVEASGGNAP
jgi:ATP phosphoribosyltransferase regulatory subunit